MAETCIVLDEKIIIIMMEKYYEEKLLNIYDAAT